MAEVNITGEGLYTCLQLLTMSDLSDHERSDDENQDPWAVFTAFVPDVTNLMSGEETLDFGRC